MGIVDLAAQQACQDIMTEEDARIFATLDAAAAMLLPSYTVVKTKTIRGVKMQPRHLKHYEDINQAFERLALEYARDDEYGYQSEYVVKEYDKNVNGR